MRNGEHLERMHRVSGISAVRLGPACDATPTLDWNGWHECTALDTFYRAGGDGLPVSGTEVRLAWNEHALYMRAVCKEDAAPEGWEERIGAVRDDKLELAIQAGSAVGPRDFDKLVIRGDGSFAAVRIREDAGIATMHEFGTDLARAEPVETPLEGCGIIVRREAAGWSCFAIYPWTLCGGKPDGPFRLQLLRVRWATDETSSPSALDMRYNYSGKLTATSDFMEATFGGEPGVLVLPETLTVLPSGVRRWQRDAVLRRASRAEMEAVLQLQLQLAAPTAADTLAERVTLAQRWIDALLLEGVDFHPGMQSSYPWKLVQPWTTRHAVNEALQHGDDAEACRRLDELLAFLNVTTRWWYADHSLGNIRTEEWIELGSLLVVEAGDHELKLRFHTGLLPYALTLTCPQEGGVRLCGEHGGAFEPGGLLPLHVSTDADGSVTILQDTFTVHVSCGLDWSIKVRDIAGRELWRLGSGSLKLRWTPQQEVQAVDLALELEPAEAVYGFGERHDATSQRGRTFTLWQRDCWESLNAGLRNHAYKNIPLLHSTRGYTLFWSTSYRMRADIGSERTDQMRLTAAGPRLDLFLWPTEPLEAIRAYTALTGKPWLPPRWAFETWAGGTYVRWKSNPERTLAQEAIAVMRTFAELDIPHSAVYAEGIPPVRELFEAMNELGVRVLAWYHPIIPEQKVRELMPDAEEGDLPLLRYERKDQLVATKDYLDFTHPRCMELLRAFWKERLDAGTVGTMIDFGDLVPDMALFCDGRKGDEVHNVYGYEYARSYKQLFEERRGDDFMLFQRCAAPGTQSFTAQFGGDVAANFAGLRHSVTGGLLLASCGFPFWGSDLGGFRGRPDEEVYLRWISYAAFTPLMRAHGQTPREPWAYSDHAVAAYRKFAWVRMNLLPYLYSSAIHSSSTGEPMMRPMALAYPYDPAAAHWDQFMLGDALLVAPVCAHGTRRTVQLPAGAWTDLWSGEATSGGRTIEVESAMDHIPVWIRSSAFVPMRLAPTLKLGDSMSAGSLNVLAVSCATDQPASGRLYHSPTQAAELSVTRSSSEQTLRLAACGELDAVLVYGSHAEHERISRIEANGVALPQLSHSDSGGEPGWLADNRRIVIRLPSPSSADKASMEDSLTLSITTTPSA